MDNVINTLRDTVRNYIHASIGLISIKIYINYEKSEKNLICTDKCTIRL